MKIKNILSLAGAVALISFAPYSAKAVPVQDTQFPGALISAGGSYGNTFDLTGGYTPGSDTLTGVSASFTFMDPAGTRSSVSILLDLSATSVTGLVMSLGLPGVTVDVTGPALSTLQTTGLLDYSVKNVSSAPDTTTLIYAALSGEVTRNARVPDGGASLMLIGVSLVGVGMLRRATKIG